jgi:fatty acid amide hydrolase 2
MKMFKEFGKALLTNLLIFTRMLVDFIVEWALEKYWGDKKVCPALKKDFFVTKSAVELAEMIRNKELTSYQVVSAYIDRIKDVNPFINAIIDGPFVEEAIGEAKKVDEKISSGSISETEWAEKPFLGVPFSTKDSTAVAGKLHTLGITSRKDKKAAENAECVRLVKNAGGIIICTSSVPEINRWQETRNNIIGQTNNPYDNRRTVGGSSGGEGALISSCCTAFGIGTDIGGSIRMPSYYCGIFGHKPSPYMINTKGCTFRTGKEMGSMVTAGPMTRYAKDLRTLFEVLVGPKNANILKLNQKVQVQKLRYFYCLDNDDIKCSKICGDLCKCMKKVTNHFANLTGQDVQLIKLKGIEKSSKMWRYWMTQEPQSFSELLGNGKSLNPFIELAKKLTGMSEFTMASIFSLIDSTLPAENAIEMKALTKQMIEEIEELLGDDGVLFYPSTTHVAPFHYQAFIQVYNFSYWSVLNVLHLPTTQVPLGLNKNGLPMGLQVVATKNRDRHCIAVAEELEREFKGWVAPFPVEK